MSGYFYIVTNVIYMEKSLYKIGKTLADRKGLKKRYQTYFIDPIIIYHRKVQGSYTTHETNLKSILKPYMVPHTEDNPSGLSEFVRMDGALLIKEVEKYFSYMEDVYSVVEVQEPDSEESSQEDDTPEEPRSPRIIYVKDEKYELDEESPSKLCSKCKTEKNICDFNKNTKGKYGVESICKRCRCEYNRYCK
jgi:hypothetical protein